MEFTVITNRTHLKLVHKATHDKESQDVLHIVYRRTETPVYYLSR
jgi:hypothetical protein